MKKILFLGLLAFTSVIYAQKPVYYLMRGKALIERGKPDEAIVALTSALELLPESSVFLERAEAFMAGGNYSAAISDFISANNLEPSSGDYGLARIYGLKGDATTAVYHLESCMRSPFKKSEKEILLDPSFSSIENRPEWRQFWQKNWFSSLEKGVAEIKYDILTGNKEGAMQIFKEISGLYKGNNEIKYAYALISNTEKKYAESLSSLSSVLAEDPENEQFLRLYAETQMLSGNFAGASSTFTKMMDLNIPDPEFIMQRAECFRRTGETAKALDDVISYLGLYPESNKALRFAGKIASASGDNLRALSFFSDNIKLHPNDAECYIDRANSYFISKSWNWAIQDYSMSLDLRPENSEVWLNKGISLLNIGKTSDACHDFRQAFSLGNKKATEYLSRHCIK
jgi:tetratricopeptide (TPR) repeat protein